jgi:hypothetical protein
LLRTAFPCQLDRAMLCYALRGHASSSGPCLVVPCVLVTACSSTGLPPARALAAAHAMCRYVLASCGELGLPINCSAMRARASPFAPRHAMPRMVVPARACHVRLCSACSGKLVWALPSRGVRAGDISFMPCLAMPWRIPATSSMPCVAMPRVLMRVRACRVWLRRACACQLMLCLDVRNRASSSIPCFYAVRGRASSCPVRQCRAWSCQALCAVSHCAVHAHASTSQPCLAVPCVPVTARSRRVLLCRARSC